MEGDYPELSIDPAKAFFIVMKAREFEGKTPSSGLEEGSNPTDDKDVAILEDSEDDATEEELTAALAELNEDEKIDVLALTWVGRGDFTMEEWDAAREEARGTVDKHFVRYLVETPLFSDYLEEGLALAGHDLDEYERDHF
ncbi:MAG TPA: DUF3775 domain-containing protein [Parvularculaceae bacterium]|nr:DUF3775 domain-containing protein [Amphiplicatus sp.]HOP21198.1 DUF3775 domain-containing protein [Amphiplicatus sp.]HPE30506.1 DUF3775 domain-containing protein [Parvularculaceae bacterium]HRX37871.1 DUF3775 domain-containing protein [Parvularculaceae bacterium]